MNRKNFFLLLALLTLNLTACSDSSEAQDRVQTAAVNSYTAVSTDTVVSGEVTAIAGNYVTLALGTVDENTDDNKSDDSSDSKPDMPADFDGEPPQMPDGENMPSGDMPSGSMPDGNMPSGNMPSGSMPAFGGRKGASLTKSGEEGSYIIPVGMTIDGLSGRSSDYSGITVGTILTLTVSEDGTVRAAAAE